MPPLKNYIGQRFGQLVVISDTIRRNGSSFVVCKCDCGVTKEVRTSNLLKAKSCGHLHPKHIMRQAEKLQSDAVKAYLRYHPQEEVIYPYFIHHLDGDHKNNEKINLIKTTATELYHASFKLPKFYPRNAETRELWRSAIELSRLLSTIWNCEKNSL